MPDTISQPVPGPGAFARDDRAAEMSQAGIILGLGQQFQTVRRTLTPLARAVSNWEDALAPASSPLTESAVPSAPAALMNATLDQQHDDISSAEFPIPKLRMSPVAVETVMHGPSAAALPEERLTARRGAAPRRQTLVETATLTFEQPVPENAQALIRLCHNHKSELVRVAAAAAALPTSPQPAELLKRIEKGISSKDPVVRELAVHALGRFFPTHPKLQRFTKRKRRPRSNEPPHTTLLVHGTWAADDDWWRPAGDFHTFMRLEIRTDTYNELDRYDWTGEYSWDARRVAAEELVDWFAAHAGPNPPSIMAHSHGGSVAMLATHMGLQLDTLILLSCPAWPGAYLPDFSHVRRVVSVRVKSDYVIYIDGGGQRFNHPHIEEDILPKWFDHSASHYPDIWREFTIADRLGLRV